LDDTEINFGLTLLGRSQDLRWYDWERYSGRQETRMKMGGFIGDITFVGNVEPFSSPLKPVTKTFALSFRKGKSFGPGNFEVIRVCP
jgi:hypothetical protein